MTYPAWLQDVADDPIYAWALSAWDRAAAVDGAWFDHAKSDKIVAGWFKIFRLTDDRFKGKAFKLIKWQEITVRLLVGWKKPIETLDAETHQATVQHVRIFRRLDLWIPRKNGKSEFLAALGILFFVLEKVHKGQAYVFGRNKDQGRVPFSKMQDIIREGVGLLEDKNGNARINLNDESFFVRETWSLCELLTGVPDGKHGRNPTVIVGDEIHEWKSRDLADFLRQGTGARLQPIELYASTAGRKNGKNRTGYEWFEESMSIMRNDVDDPTTLVVYFGIGDDDDWTDETTWRKANPSIGLTPTLDYLRTEFKKAKGRPAQEAIFQCYHLNRWVDQITGWLPRDKWQACTAKPGSWKTLWETHKGRTGYLTCDIGATRDLTALVVTLPPDENHDRWVIIPLFWIPEGTLNERASEDKRIDWRKLVADGAILTTPGDATDLDFVEEAIKLACASFDIVKFGYDEWNSRQLIGNLQKAGMDADIMTVMPQGHRTLGAGTKELERLVFAAKVEHGGHPVLAWMAANAIVRFDVNLNYVPDKLHSLDKIDGIVAAVMGIALTIVPEEPEATSPWDDPDYEHEA